MRVRVSSFFLPKWSAIRPEGTSKTYVKAKVTECSTPIWKSEERRWQVKVRRVRDAPGEVCGARGVRGGRGEGAEGVHGVSMGPA